VFLVNEMTPVPSEFVKFYQINVYKHDLTGSLELDGTFNYTTKSQRDTVALQMLDAGTVISFEPD
jgi:hypothetical protein